MVPSPELASRWRRDILVKPLVVVIHLQERGYILVELLVVNHRSSGVLTRVPHLDEAILISHHGDVGVKAEVGIQGRVVTLNSLVPKTKTESKYSQFSLSRSNHERLVFGKRWMFCFHI